MAKSGKISKGKRIAIAFGIVILFSLIAIGYSFYTKVFFPNVSLIDQKEQYIYIPTGSSFTDVLNILRDENLLKNQASFEWVSEQMKYKNAADILSGKI